MFRLLPHPNSDMPFVRVADEALFAGEVKVDHRVEAFPLVLDYDRRGCIAPHCDELQLLHDFLEAVGILCARARVSDDGNKG